MLLVERQRSSPLVLVKDLVSTLVAVQDLVSTLVAVQDLMGRGFLGTAIQSRPMPPAL